MFLSFEYFLTPTIIYQANFSKCRSSSVPIQLKEIKKTKIAGLDTETFDVKQEFYTSEDGTKNPFNPDDANDFEFIYKYSPQHPFDQRCAVAVHVLAVRGAMKRIGGCSLQSAAT
uniref:Uncharacterized protein n=1 Tax=Ditylenchus dipsaci TaxID=166011 RepID=A0A915EIX0_9BILA